MDEDLVRLACAMLSVGSLWYIITSYLSFTVQKIIYILLATFFLIDREFKKP